jgi:redox-sensitive bicupin YhaK (pirin superfamily)
VQVARGGIDTNGEDLRAGDGAAIEDETTVILKGLTADAEFLLFDLP